MDQQISLNEEPTSMLIFQEKEEKPNKRLADPITTPRKGPLVLSKRVKEGTHPTTITQRSKTHSQNFPRSRTRYLNRFPIPNIQRPIDAIESSLGRLSLAELKQQAFNDWSGGRHSPVLPTLNPLMKYTPIGHHGDTMMKSHTHKANDPMDILITYSRHTTPRGYPTQDWVSPLCVEPRHMPSGHNPQNRRQTTPMTAQGRTTLLTHTNVQEFKESSGMSQEAPLSPRQNLLQQGQLLTGLVRPTLAPQSLHAVAVHKFKPVTAQTILKGQSLYPHTLNTK